MPIPPPVKTFDLAELSIAEGYKLLTGTVVPRPIAWVTTMDPEGRVNAAPFSFFNMLSSDPPLLALGIGRRPGQPGVLKDTTENIRSTGQFTVNIADSALAEAMNVTGAPVDAGIDELALAGLTAVQGTKVRTPRIAEAPAALECERHSIIEVGEAGQSIVLGRVLTLHLRADLVDERLHVDPAKLDALGRLSGSSYATIRDRFELDRLTAADALAGRRNPRRPG